MRAAYRIAAKAVHPDIEGGDAEAFARLKLAHDVLTDPVRRDRYDRTGEFEPTGADNEQAMLLTMLAAAFDDACLAAIEAKEELTQVDLVQRMREALTRRVEEIRRNAAEAGKAAGLFEPLLGRFSLAARPQEQANLLEGVVRQKIAAATDFQARASDDVTRLERASAFLSVWRYRSDPLPDKPLVARQIAPGMGAANDFMNDMMRQQRNARSR